MAQAQVSIIIGSDSDLSGMKPALDMLEHFSVPFELHIASAHRSPGLVRTLVGNFEKKGIQVIVAGAGGAAHLPGVIAAETALPVIGIPMKTEALSGMDSLYSIVQMPQGIPVATMAIGPAGAANGAILAIQILSLKNSALKKKLIRYKRKLASDVSDKSARLKKIGFRNYIKNRETGK